MYFGPPPQHLPTEIFTTVPDHLRTGPGGKRAGALHDLLLGLGWTVQSRHVRHQSTFVVSPPRYASRMRGSRINSFAGPDSMMRPVCST